MQPAGFIHQLIWNAAGIPAGADSENRPGTGLDPEHRRGATAGERAAVSEPLYTDRALTGTWRWGPFRIVAAEDAWNCLPSGHCPFVLLDSHGTVRLEGIALERPSVCAGGVLIWITPDGGLTRASPEGGG